MSTDGRQRAAVPAATEGAVAAALEPLTRDPARAAVFCDIDGTLAPIVPRPDEARVPSGVSRLLGRLSRRYACVACISGRPAEEARDLVGQGSVIYVGLHGAEVLRPGESRACLASAYRRWRGRVRRFGSSCDPDSLRRAGVRIEDKGPILGFHWRGAADEGVALACLADVAERADAAGLAAHWGRKVLEVRPPVPIDKGIAVRELVTATHPAAALYGGDDTTDLDAFDALAALASAGRLDARVRVAVRSDEEPIDLVARADLVVDGVPGFARVLDRLLVGAGLSQGAPGPALPPIHPPRT